MRNPRTSSDARGFLLSQQRWCLADAQVLAHNIGQIGTE
jgi:hypothetical protein